jgi:hypothetical protein
MKPTVWTGKRKWLGNLIPACFWFPLMAAGIAFIVLRAEVIGIGLWLLVAATIVGWIALGFFGLYDNERMKRQLRRILEARDIDPGDAPFVGIATPKYSSALDPHEDVGYLIFLPDRLRFISEHRTIELQHSQLQRVRLRPNVHTLVGLGRWVSVEGLASGRPIRLLIESRESPRLWRNFGRTANLRKRIDTWLRSSHTEITGG